MAYYSYSSSSWRSNYSTGLTSSWSRSYGSNSSSSDRYLGARYTRPGTTNSSGSPWSRPYERSSVYNGGSTRPRFQPNSYKPDRDVNYWRNRYPPSPSRKSTVSIDVLNDENRKAHHTEPYGVDDLVIRRGQSFDLNLTFDLESSNSFEEVTLKFSTGENPQQSKGTMQRLTACEESTQDDNDLMTWRACVRSISKDSVRVSVTPAATAIVGEYKLQVEVTVKTDNQTTTISGDLSGSIYLLFNSWCKDDDVYLEDEKERDEYVLNESGRVYRDVKGTPWVFGQFARASLQAAVYLLAKSSTCKQSHGSSVVAMRALSAMVNCNDDDGVLTGNWSGDYADGTSPSEWISSIPILEKYMRYKRPVKYGQCWVFSAVTVSVCRAVGLPCRSVTNFDSAHDSDGSLTIDRHYDENGKTLPDLDDSVWNFHVWNEGWCKRTDLPPGYDGWQAFDATPQEQSEGKMRCGPASVKAIKDGDVYLNYDTRFIFSEVNGDRLVWIVDHDNNMIPIKQYLDTSSVGKNISTKAVGSNERQDLTENYKYPEGSPEERAAVKKASTFVSGEKRQILAQRVYNTNEDVVFTCDESCVDGDLSVEIKLTNKSKHKKRSGFVRINATAVYYTGIEAQAIDSQKITFDLDPQKDTVMSWSVKAINYLNLIAEDADVKVAVLGFISETDQYFMKEHAFHIDTDDIEIQVSNNNPQVGEALNVILTITNPVNIDLTNGIIHVEGPGIQKDLMIRLKSAIGGKQKYTEEIEMTPKHPGTREIVASFKSKQIVGITGAAVVDVKDSYQF